MESVACRKCSGVVNCNKYCEVQAAYSMIRYITGVDKVETKIGDLSSREWQGEQDLVVSGHMVCDRALSPGNILTDISTVLDTTQKLNSVFGKTPVQLINSCRDKFNLTAENTMGLCELISKISKNRMLVLPLKPGDTCTVKVFKPTGGDYTTDCCIQNISWKTNKETHLLEAIVLFSPNQNTSKHLKYKFTEYMDKFKLKKLGMKALGDDCDLSVIKMNNYGMILPVMVKSRFDAYAVDGTYLYRVEDDDVKIVGRWANGYGSSSCSLKIDSTTKSKAMEKIKNSAALLSVHRKYIAPYAICNPNVIEV